ncbi:hypothetical protein H4W31_008256 [Plantactinospora soyae]|uniref:Uncharacterized protein n=1 Tax=Plantactinospora soyae TaxID=1544732 RepID=A0A927MDA2_9ACTN|nr:hypothetical protein [Plantactinospora soyae]
MRMHFCAHIRETAPLWHAEHAAPATTPHFLNSTHRHVDQNCCFRNFDGIVQSRSAIATGTTSNFLGEELLSILIGNRREVPLCSTMRTPGQGDGNRPYARCCRVTNSEIPVRTAGSAQRPPRPMVGSLPSTTSAVQPPGARTGPDRRQLRAVDDSGRQRTLDRRRSPGRGRTYRESWIIVASGSAPFPDTVAGFRWAPTPAGRAYEAESAGRAAPKRERHGSSRATRFRRREVGGTGSDPLKARQHPRAGTTAAMRAVEEIIERQRRPEILARIRTGRDQFGRLPTVNMIGFSPVRDGSRRPASRRAAADRRAVSLDDLWSFPRCCCWSARGSPPAR